MLGRERREGEPSLDFGDDEKFMMGWVLRRREECYFDGIQGEGSMADLRMLLGALQRERRDVLAEAIWRVVESTHRTGHLPQITDTKF